MSRMPRVRGLRTDPTIRSRLGPELLAELQANLWAIDCQTCNQPLGWRKPSITVASSDDGIAEVALHHRRCQSPRWESTTKFPRFGLHQSWRMGGYCVLDAGLVVYLINPSCEVATLVSTDTGWRLANLDGYLIAGMESGWPGESPPLPGLSGSLDSGVVTVDLEVNGDSIGTWTSGSLPEPLTAEIHKYDVVLVGMTTAIDVTTGIRPEVVDALIDRRQVVLAWATVTAAAAGPGLGEEAKLAVNAAVDGDGSLLAALHGLQQIYAVFAVASLFAMLPREADQPDGVHIVVPDEPTGLRIEATGGPVLGALGQSVIHLPAPELPSGSDVVIGTPEQFTTRSYGAVMAIFMGVSTETLPYHYERVLAI